MLVGPDPVSRLRHKKKLKCAGQKVFTFYPSLGMLGRIMAPKEIHPLVPKTCKHVTLHSKGDFVDMIMVTNFEMEKLF